MAAYERKGVDAEVVADQHDVDLFDINHVQRPYVVPDVVFDVRHSVHNYRSINKDKWEVAKNYKRAKSEKHIDMKNITKLAEIAYLDSQFLTLHISYLHLHIVLMA